MMQVMMHLHHFFLKDRNIPGLQEDLGEVGRKSA
jgi:hypothetical protein